ncbi:family 43 glycosylhydrolase [Neolewinella persica]|uniref:family 43 glycosylhydrolase n=1 Tax=Neolewinella persica TaxID=70998 RepID=UPI0003773C34|nr:family 43 glycosylhydrolase [Neolewinella persica]
MLRYLPLLLCLSLCTCAPAPENSPGKSVTLSNLEPRRTTDGKIVDAHDGRIIQFGEFFYWYGTQYGTTNGFTKANEYHVYRSPDMVNWEHIGAALAEAPAGVYYRPHVIFNEASGKYVLWYNWYPELWDGHFGVAVSDTPEGPFRIVSSDVAVAHSELGVGDFGLFVDEDRTAYISYNTINGHRVSVEKLTPDYLGSTKENGGYIAQYCEAGSMFKRNDIYYLLTDYTCCFCNQGAGARVYMTDNPLGQWTLTNNINRRPGWRETELTDGVTFTTEYVALKRKPDSTFQHLILDMKPGRSGNGIKLWVFTGNRQGQCGEVDNPRVHERILRPSFTFEYYDHGWKPLSINDAFASDQNMLQIIGHGLNNSEGVTRVRITPQTDYPYDEVRLTEVSDNVEEAWVSDGQPGPIIIPAQQTYVMDIQTASGTEFLWMGDLWGSASDNVKGHDYQYWSSPLRFDAQGWIEPLELEGEVVLPLLSTGATDR